MTQQHTRRRVLQLTAATAAATAAGAATAQARQLEAVAADRTVFVGAYTTPGGATGIGRSGYSTGTGALTRPITAAITENPSFLALSADRGVLYAVNERSSGAVSAFRTTGTGLQPLGSRSTGGSGPCHLTVHSAGRHVLSANYDSGSVAVHPINVDGSLAARCDLVQHAGSGPDPDRQRGPHAHMVCNDPAGNFVLAADLGTDSVYTYRLDTGTGRLSRVAQAHLTAGSGPRHLAFHPSGRHLYIVNELNSTVTTCTYDHQSGTVNLLGSLGTVPPGSSPASRNYPAEIAVSADGATVYVSNRGHDSIARFATQADGAALTLIDATPSGGATPRHISLDPVGAWLFAANQTSGNITTFRVAADGSLTRGPATATPAPVCVVAL